MKKKEINNLTHALQVLAEAYVWVGWPESQQYMEEDWWEEEVLKDGIGITYGPGEYMIPVKRLYNIPISFHPDSPEREDYVVEGRSPSRTLYLRGDGQWDADIDNSLRLDTYAQAEAIRRVMITNTPFAELSVGTTTNSPQGFAYND